MTDTPRKRGPKPGKRHAGQNPDHLGEYLQRLPDGWQSRNIRIAAPQAVHDALLGLSSLERGELIAKALGIKLP